MPPLPHPLGHYRFLRGIAPYSCGVIAAAGHEIVRVVPRQPFPWRDGFEFIDFFLRREGRARTDLCALELRSPAPWSMSGFIGFNRGYCAVLEGWGLLVDGLNPLARTNVAPVDAPPSVPSLHAFSFVRPIPATRAASESPAPTFVVAGAGELREGILESERIVHRGDTSAAGLLAKASHVLEVMAERLHGLGVDWSKVTASNVYTAHVLDEPWRALLQRRLGPASRHGVCWHVARPPVLEIEFEMDLHAAAREWHVDVHP